MLKLSERIANWLREGRIRRRGEVVRQVRELAQGSKGLCTDAEIERRIFGNNLKPRKESRTEC